MRATETTHYPSQVSVSLDMALGKSPEKRHESVATDLSRDLGVSWSWKIGQGARVYSAG
jgi:hypothetical protein